MSEDDLGELLDAGEAADEFEVIARLEAIRGHSDLSPPEALDATTAFRAARLLAASGEPSDLPNVARLSLVAHEGGIEGAGRIHAEASDKISLYTGRPQPFGTVMIEHDGDIVQPPVDPSITDEQRGELGLPSLDEMQRRMRELAHDLATERANQPGWLPPGKRFCRVWNDPDPAELRARLEVEGTAWADGDILTFVTESTEPVTVTPVFSIPTWDAGDGLQALSVRVERLDEAVITYTFTPQHGFGAMRMSRGSHDGRFRGPRAPAELPSNDPLVGTSFEHAIESEAFGEPRRVSVYRPPGHEPRTDTPVVYATDGGMFAPYARRLDAAIESGECPPVVVVAAHSAAFDPIEGNLRAAEYLPGFDSHRFDAHHAFFCDELVDWAEAELGVPANPSRRGVFGCSDGAGHALMIAQLQPQQFGHVFAFSTGMPPDISAPWDRAAQPFLHLCAGTLEGAFHQATEAWAGYLHLNDARYHFTERVCGHDLIQWCEELPRALARAWGG